jgi:hypothetical protein
MTQENYFLYTCIEYKFEILTLAITIKFQNFNRKQDYFPSMKNMMKNYMGV